MTDLPRFRRSPRSMERIERPSEKMPGYTVYAGDLGNSIGTYRTLREAKDALDTWHYFNPEEQRAREVAWVRSFTQTMHEAAHEGGLPAVEALLAHWDARYPA